MTDVTVSAGARVSSKGESSGESASKVTHITAGMIPVLRAVAFPCRMVISMQTLHQSKHMKEEFQRPKSVFYNFSFVCVCVFVEITSYDFAVFYCLEADQLV